MPGYYDVVLGLIPLSLAGLTALLFAGGISLPVAMPVASTATVDATGDPEAALEDAFRAFWTTRLFLI